MYLDDLDDEVVMMDKVRNNANCETYCCWTLGTTTVLALRVVIVYKSIQWFACTFSTEIFRAPWWAWTIPQHWSWTSHRCLQVVVWKEGSVSLPSSYGPQLPYNSRYINQMNHNTASTDLCLWKLATSVDVSVGEVWFQTDSNSVWTKPKPSFRFPVWEILAQTKRFGFRFQPFQFSQMVSNSV